MNDIALRAIKTFLQSFFGVLLPELYVFTQPDFPVDVSTPALIFVPMLCAGLSAGISAVGNMFGKLLLPDEDVGEYYADPTIYFEDDYLDDTEDDISDT